MHTRTGDSSMKGSGSSVGSVVTVGLGMSPWFSDQIEAPVVVQVSDLEAQGAGVGGEEDGGLEAAIALAQRHTGEIYYRLHEYHKALQHLTSAIEQNPQDDLAYRYRGAAYEAVGQRQQAIMDFQSAARLGNEPAQQLLQSWGISW